MLKEIRFPHSLGLRYAGFTYYTGFKVNSGEYKLMGLAPYGEPRYANLIFDHLIDLKPDGSFHLNQEYFGYCVGLRITNGSFDRLFGGSPHAADAILEQRDMDLAASIQAVTNEVIVRMVRSLVAETGLRKLCLACAAGLSMLFGFSWRPAMPAARSVPRSRHITNFLISQDGLETFLTGCRAPISARALRRRRLRIGCAVLGRFSGLWRTKRH
jgi:hypothetical protein